MRIEPIEGWSPYTMASLFAGSGLFELAAIWAGIRPIWSNEKNKKSVQGLKRKFSHRIYEQDIKELDGKQLPAVDIICGGDPYFGFGPAPYGHISRDIIESGIVRMLDGLPEGMDYPDRFHRIKECGQAIVPQVAYEFLRWMRMYLDGEA